MSSLPPFSLPGQWYKGNLHTHTTQSDGAFTPEQAIAWYRERGYDFLAITDHWVWTAGRSAGASRDFVTITGTELHGPTYHLLALGLRDLPKREIADSPQAIVRTVVELGGLPFFAHPYWTGQSSSDILAVEGLAGIEVFNAVCEKINGLGYSNVQWDELLGRGRRLWGLAVDDVHWRHGAEGQGYVIVRAEALDETHILDALRRGHFYASTGPTIADLYTGVGEGGQPTLYVRCSPCANITFHAFGPRGWRFEASPGTALESASFPIKSEQVYLRVQCHDAGGGIAWTNPFFVDDLLP